MIDLKRGPSCDVCGRTFCLKPGNVLTQWSSGIDFIVCDRASCNDTACSEVGAQMRTAKRRAHADTAPQPSTLDAAADFDPIQASYDSFRLDVAKAVVEAAKQHVPVDQLTTWQRQHLGDWVPLREPVPCVAETGHRTYARIDLAKLTKDPTSPGFVYFVDSKSGHVSRMTNVSESGEAALAANGIFRTEHTSGPVDPLDVEYDHVPLRRLVMFDEMYRREEVPSSPRHAFTPAQRSAISAHWSAALRAKVAATKQAEREQVVCERDEDGL